MLNLSTFEIEKKSVFFVNLLLILCMIVFFLNNIPVRYFFYIDIVLTIILSFFFFKRSRKLSKYLILTNMFIFFCFLYPVVTTYLIDLLAGDSYLFILFYHLFVSYVFLVFSGMHKDFIKDIGSVNLKVSLIVVLVGFTFGVIFFLVREPVPSNLMMGSISMIIFYTLILAISEQMIFTGFLSNVYRQLTGVNDSYFQVATIFVLFHLLRFENLVVTYFRNFDFYYLYLITLYYMLLFVFMLCCLYFYNFKGKKYKGNFFYPVFLHFVTDLTLLLFTIFIGYI